MATVTRYNQPQISVEEQIATLKNEDLVFTNEDKAKHLLNHISLFRMKSYLHPFRKTGERSFKQGATFEQVYILYKFDSELRKLICSELEKIEVSIRPLVPKHTAHPFLSNPTLNNRTFYVLSIILYLLKTVNPQNTLAERVRILLNKYPSVDYIAMGFPHNWEQEPL